MPNPLKADDILPLVARLTAEERLRLIRLITPKPGAKDAEIYRSLPVLADEFSTDEDALSWEAEGWEDPA
jgi:hypothetical protein